MVCRCIVESTATAAHCLLLVLCVCGVQGVLEKLAREVERNIQLSSELKEGENGKQRAQTHTQVLSNCGCVVVLGAGEGTGREQSSDRQSGSAGDRYEETALGAPEKDQ